jgi:Putative, 10TM heavy-metal exporter
MKSILLKVFEDTIQITLLVTIMMILIDIVNLWSKGKIGILLRKKGKFRQYVVSSFVGTIPGCFGGFTNVSLYIHGLISFGALAGSMIAVSGDEAFVMIAMFPKTAIILFIVLFIIGIFAGKLVDLIVKRFKISTCNDCSELVIHNTKRNFKHFIKEHVFVHIIKKHVWKIALWTFGALIVVEISLRYLNLEQFTTSYPIIFLFVGALIGLIPESGPHLIFVTLFASGLIPFSVLLTSSIVQDGHGMLPLLSYSLKDSIKIKLFNFVFGLVIGLTLFFLGL